MTKVTIEVELDDSKLEDYIMDLVERSDKFQPVVFGCSDPMAKQVEFGMNNGGAVFSAKNPPEGFKKWIGEMYGLSGKARDDKARQVYYLLQKDGMHPIPFLRPAMHSVMNRVKSQKYWFDKKGNDSLELARLISEEMKRIIAESRIPMGPELIEHVFYNKGTDVEMGSYMQSMPDNVMATDDTDFKGRPIDGKNKRY